MTWYALVMSHDHIRLRYDGPALADHSIEIDDLAPALLAIADLCKITNKRFNGERAVVKVLVKADLEQGCFELDLQLVVSIYESAKQVVALSDVASAKEILEWLGIIAMGAGAPWGLIKFLGYLKGRKITEKKLVVKDGKDVTQISVEGDNNTVIVHQQTAELLEDARAIAKVQKVVEPLAKEGFDRLEFEETPERIETVSKEEAESILAIGRDYELESLDDVAGQTLTAWIRIYSPVYESDVQNWRFWYGENHQYIDISETDIAEKALERGGTGADDLYKVRLEITQSLTPTGKIKNHYKILNVLEFRPGRPMQQIELLQDDKPERSSEKE